MMTPKSERELGYREEGGCFKKKNWKRRVKEKEEEMFEICTDIIGLPGLPSKTWFRGCTPMWPHSHNGHTVAGSAGEGSGDGALRTSTSGAGKEKQPPQEARDSQKGKRGARET